MINSAESPILVTYRSAEALRDAGIKYAYLKAGVFAAFWVAVFFLMCGLWLYREARSIPIHWRGWRSCSPSLLDWSWWLVVGQLSSHIARA